MLWTCAAAPAETGSADKCFWAPATPPRANYQVDCEVDPDAGRIKGTETIRLTNPARRAMHRLALYYPIAPKQPLEVSADGKPVTLAGGDPWLIDLPQPLAAGRTVRLDVKFSLERPAKGGLKFYVASGWFPRLGWGFPTTDDFTVRLRVPRQYRLATSGWYDEKAGAWRGERLRDFRFVIWQDMRAMEGNAAGVKVTVLHTDKGAECARVIYDTAVDTIKFFEQRFGFYPHRSFIVVPGGDRPVGGYPNGTAIVVVHGQERFTEKPLAHWRWTAAGKC